MKKKYKYIIYIIIELKADIFKTKIFLNQKRLENIKIYNLVNIFDNKKY